MNKEEKREYNKKYRQKPEVKKAMIKYSKERYMRMAEMRKIREEKLKKMSPEELIRLVGDNSRNQR